MKKSLLAAVISCFMAQIAISQTWQLTGSGTNNWVSIASSANGHTVIAGQWPGAVGVSTNAGVTWTNVMTNGYWNSVASSADGTKLLASAFYVDSAHIGGVFLSTNSGASWTSNSFPVLDWASVAMSADGNTMAAVAPFYSDGATPNGAVFCSTNSGVSWVSNNMATVIGSSPIPEVSVAMSADGRKIFVAGAFQLCYSTNFGTSWMQMTSAPPCYAINPLGQCIASSADGNRLIFSESPASGGRYIYISTNSGNTWSLTPIPESYGLFVASSADGQTLMAGTGLPPGYSASDSLFISTNFGASWATNASENWTGVACSADGGTLFAVASSDTNSDGNTGAIYKSQFVRSSLLNAAPSAGNLQLSWLIPSTDFVLEQSPDLENWTPVTNTPVLNPASLEDQILISPTNDAGFYRLVNRWN
jgi:hypothetical protein